MVEIRKLTDDWKSTEEKTNNEIAAYKEKINKFEDQNQNLKRQLEDSNNNISNLETQLQVRTTTIEQLNTQITSTSGNYKERILQVNTTVQSLMTQVDEKSQELQKSLSEISELKMKLSQKENHHSRQLNDFKQDIIEYTDRINELKQQDEANQKEMADRKQHFDEVIEEKEKKIDNLNGELSNLQSQSIKKIESIQQKLTEENLSLKKDFNNFQEKLKSEISAYQDQISNLNSELEAKSSKLSSIEEAKNKVASELSTTSKLYENLKNDKEKLENLFSSALNNKQEGDSKHNLIITQLNADLQSLKSELEIHEKSSAALKEDLENKTTAYEKLKIEFKKVEKSKEKSKNQLISRTESIERAQNELSEKCQKYEAKIQELLNSNEKLRSQASQGEVRQVSAFEQNENLAKKIQNLENENTDLKKEIKLLNKSNTPTKSVAFYDEVEAQNTIQNLQMEMAKLKANNVESGNKFIKEMNQMSNKLIQTETEKQDIEMKLRRLSAIQGQIQQAHDVSIMELKQQIEISKNQLNEGHSKFAELNNRYTDSNQRCASLQKRVRALEIKEREIKTLEQEKALLNGKFIEMLNDCRNLRSQKLELEDYFRQNRIELIQLQSENQQLRAGLDAQENNSKQKNFNFDSFESILKNAVNERVKLEVHLKQMKKSKELALENMEHVWQEKILAKVQEYETSLNQQKSNFQDEIEKYKNDLIKISSERDSNHRIMQTKDVVINRLESDIKSKNDKSRRLERELREVKSKYSKYEDRFDEPFRQEPVRITENTKNLSVQSDKSVFADLGENQVKILEKEISMLHRTIDELQKYEAKVNEMEEEMESLKNQLDTATRRTCSSELSGRGTPNGGNRELCRQIESLVIEKQRLQRERDALRRELNSKQDKEHDFDELREKFVSAVSSKTKLQSEIDKLRQEITSNREEKRRLQTKNQELEDKISSSNQERDQLIDRNNMLDSDLKAIRNQLDEEYQARSAIIMELNQRIDELIAEKHKLLAKMQELESDSATAEILKRLQTIILEKDDIQAQLDEKLEQYNEQLDKNTRLESEISFLNTQVDELKTKEQRKGSLASVTFEQTNQDGINSHILMCELEDLKDQLETETRLRKQVEQKMENLKESQKESSNLENKDDAKIQQQIADLETSKKELDDLTVFLCQFETALLEELRKSSNENDQITIPEVSENATRQERLQLFISTYFNFQETRNKQLNVTTERLSQLESAIMEKLDSNNSSATEKDKNHYVEILSESRDNFNSASEPLKMGAPKSSNKKSLAKKEGLQVTPGKRGGPKKLAGRKKGQVQKSAAATTAAPSSSPPSNINNQETPSNIEDNTQIDALPEKSKTPTGLEKTTADLFAAEPLAPSPAQDFNDDSLKI